jgi:hypothetical protein
VKARGSVVENTGITAVKQTSGKRDCISALAVWVSYVDILYTAAFVIT